MKTKLLKKLSWINTQLLISSGIRRDHFVRAKRIIKSKLSKLKRNGKAQKKRNCKLGKSSAQT